MTLRSLLAMTLLTTSMSMTAIPQNPAAIDTFEREVLKALNASQEAKRGVVIHVNGEAISGIVKAIGPDVILLSNREHARILIRRDRIYAVEAE